MQTISPKKNGQGEGPNIEATNNESIWEEKEMELLSNVIENWTEIN